MDGRQPAIRKNYKMKYFAIFLAAMLLVNLATAQNTTQKRAPLENAPEVYSAEKRYQPFRETAFLGIYSEQLSEEKARKLGFDNLYGSYVTRVVENSAAERAGVRPLDYIYGVDEYRTGKEQNLTHIIRKYKPGQPAVLHLYRRGEKQALKATFGARTESKSRERDKCEDPFLGISAAGKRGEAPDGVTVNIIDNSTAEAIGMQDGDHIIAINGYRMLDWQDISTAINAMKVGEKITVEVARNGKEQKMRGPIKSYCETKPEKALNMDIQVAPQPGEWFDRYFKKGEKKEIVIVGPEQVEVDVRSLGADEAIKLEREKKITLKAVNNLALEGLTIEQDGDGFEMEFTLPGRGETSIRIYNEAGRLIYLYDLGNFSGEFRDEVNLSQNDTGNFYLEIRQGDKSAAKKITLSSK